MVRASGILASNAVGQTFLDTSEWYAGAEVGSGLQAVQERRGEAAGRARRAQRGMTQVEAARGLEMSQATIAKWQEAVSRRSLRGARVARTRERRASKREADLQAQIEELTNGARWGLRRAARLAERGALYPRARS